MTTTEQLLAERGSTHGKYEDHALCTQSLEETFRSWSNWDRLTHTQKETLHMVAHKIGRILTGNPNIKDHWADIAGYATLVANELRDPAPKHADVFNNLAAYSEEELRSLAEHASAIVEARTRRNNSAGVLPNLGAVLASIAPGVGYGQRNQYTRAEQPPENTLPPGTPDDGGHHDQASAD